MKTSLFDFDLPESQIAQYPVSPRHMAKLLHIKDQKFHDHHAIDLPDLLQEGDLLIFNNTKVIPSRLFANKETGAKIEIMLHKQESLGIWRAFARPARKVPKGTVIYFNDQTSALIEESFGEGEILLKFNMEATEVMPWLEQYAAMPLPPYIRGGIASGEDETNYQTIYAKEKGAVAAPTAGLHFTEELFTRLKQKGIKHQEVTLHVGAGTFLPVKADNILDHKMHAEWGKISTETCDAIMETKRSGGRVIAVGTTSLRILESAAIKKGEIKPWQGETDIFIYPGFEFSIIDGLLTNFHLPQSTLFMLVSAICGLQTMKDAYQYAIDNQYRFYSYGDCCLMYPTDQKEV